MKDKPDQYFILFSCCFITRGFNRSIIVDTQRNNFHFIPQVLGDLIKEMSEKKLQDILRDFDDEDKILFHEYLSFLEKNELGFFTNNPAMFPQIDLTYRSSNNISNAILDFRKNIGYPMGARLKELEALGCEAIQIRIFENLTLPTFYSLLENFKNLTFHNIEVLLNADEVYNKKQLLKVLKETPNLNRIILYNSPYNYLKQLNYYQMFEFRSSYLESITQCGQIGAKYFTTNINHVVESHHFNSCLNKKIAIDEHGDIKNCPSMIQNFGSAKDSSLTDTLKKEGFKKLWSVNKDKVEVCKDCEFRHICTDCRAYTQNAGIDNGKPIKCGYDPYSNIWEDWSLNTLSSLQNVV